MNTDTENTFIPCKTEVRNPNVDWELSWSLANLGGLCSVQKTFLWKMLHNILPTQERLFRLGMRNAPSSHCTSCTQPHQDSPSHTLISCTNNQQVADWLLQILQPHVHNVSPDSLVLLDIGQVQDDLQLPVVWILAEVLGHIWSCRREKKKPQLFQTRAVLEAGIEILRKTSVSDAASKIDQIVKSG